MQIFIRHDKSGKILSVAKVESMPEGLKHPFLLVDKNERVLELKGNDIPAGKGCHEIHDSYVVDVKKKKLKTKP